MLCFSLTPEQLKLHGAMNLTFPEFFEYFMKTAKKHWVYVTHQILLKILSGTVFHPINFPSR